MGVTSHEWEIASKWPRYRSTCRMSSNPAITEGFAARIDQREKEDGPETNSRGRGNGRQAGAVPRSFAASDCRTASHQPRNGTSDRRQDLATAVRAMPRLRRQGAIALRGMHDAQGPGRGAHRPGPAGLNPRETVSVSRSGVGGELSLALPEAPPPQIISREMISDSDSTSRCDPLCERGARPRLRRGCFQSERTSLATPADPATPIVALQF